MASERGACARSARPTAPTCATTSGAIEPAHGAAAEGAPPATSAIVGFTAEVTAARSWPRLGAAARRAGHGGPRQRHAARSRCACGLPPRADRARRSVAAGADLVTFSGDKLLGGPQAGIIVGRADLVERIRKNPLHRALRIDKLTLAALESTLRLYRDEAVAIARIPTLRMLTEPEERVRERARELADRLQALGAGRLEIELVRRPSMAGGGSLPTMELPSCCLRVRVAGVPDHRLELALRNHEPPVIGRIEEGAFVMDARTLQPDEPALIAAAFDAVLKAF